MRKFKGFENRTKENIFENTIEVSDNTVEKTQVYTYLENDTYKNHGNNENIPTIVKTTDPKKRRKYFKSEAKCILFKKGNWLTLVFCSFICIMLTVSIKYMTESFFTIFTTGIFENVTPELASILHYLASYVNDVLYVAFLVPLYIGLYTFMVKLYEGTTDDDVQQDLSMGTIFNNFNSLIKLSKAYKVFFAYFWRIALYFSILMLTLIASTETYTKMYEYGYFDITTEVMISIYIFSIIFAVVGLIFLTRYYLVLYISIKNPEMTIHNVIKCSKKAMKKNLIETISLFFSFILLAILSFLSLGILFVLFTIPYFLFTNIAYSEYLYDRVAENIENGTYIKKAIKVSKINKDYESIILENQF